MRFKNLPGLLAVMAMLSTAAMGHDKPGIRAHSDETVLAGGPVAVPSGFVDETFSTDWNFAVGINFMPDGRMVIFERAGRIWLVDTEGNRAHDPMIDLSEEIESSIDRGLMDVVFDPDFASNGYMYLLYQVDWYYHENFGTPEYNPNGNAYSRATFARITRYTLRPELNYTEVDPASRTILLGATPTDGFPVVAPFHGIGSMFFGEDGTLLVTCGDSGSFNTNDMGGDVIGSYAAGAIADNLIRPAEDVGSLRAQMHDSLAGKVIRIDRTNGEGVSSNPFYDPAEPRAARSRVWTLGFRMPYRGTLRPGTGSSNPADADPGTIYLGEVGNNAYEEINAIPTGGLNCGWPIFEGLVHRDVFANANVLNEDVPNPLFDGVTCTQEFLKFRELIVQATESGVGSFPNPCDAGQQLPSSVPTFVHHRPALEIGHNAAPARVGTFVDGEPAEVILGEPGSPATGSPFGGNAVIGGDFCPPISFPVEYHGKYFFADYSLNWMRAAEFDAQDELVSVEQFAANLHTHVYMRFSPVDGSLYYIRYPDTIRRMRYVAGNQPPVLSVTSDKQYGAGPLTVQFDASGTIDPEDEPLAFEWDFGDGTPISTEAAPQHTFMAPDSNPISYSVVLTVTDVGGEVVTETMLISVNNTPPMVTIDSPIDGALYSLFDGDVNVSLQATIVDAEHSVGEYTCEWQTILHHNDHNHPGIPNAVCSMSETFEALGCEEVDEYWYVFKLTVTDDAGLVTEKFVSLYPDCSFLPDCPGDVAPDNGDGTYGNGVVNVDDLLAIINAFGAPCDGCPEDVEPLGFGNGVVNIDDLLRIINSFGICEDE
ncbi:MAG: PQQ-dependent sugar dehydrogenase [Planctomycetota bacterium]